VVEVPPVEIATLSQSSSGEVSADVRRRVIEARGRQSERFGRSGPSCNARMSSRDLEIHAPLGPGPAKLLARALATLSLSARGFDRIRRVARTLADLESVQIVQERPVAEAVQYKKESAAVGIAGP
jgi:magnesium chelatase family protein